MLHNVSAPVIWTIWTKTFSFRLLRIGSNKDKRHIVHRNRIQCACSERSAHKLLRRFRKSVSMAPKYCYGCRMLTAGVQLELTYSFLIRGIHGILFQMEGYCKRKVTEQTVHTSYVHENYVMADLL
jgi:hypothetical protein